MVENICAGVISGILATVITNAVIQYWAELRLIKKIQRYINEYLYNLEKYKEIKPQTVLAKGNEDEADAYAEMKVLFDALYLNVNEQAASLFWGKSKADQIMLRFTNIYKRINDEKQFDISYCITSLKELVNQI